MGTVFAEMSSQTALTRHLGMKKTFSTKYIKSKYVQSFITKRFFFKILFNKNAYWHKSSTKTQFYEFPVLEGCITLGKNFLQSLWIFTFEIPCITSPSLSITYWSPAQRKSISLYSQSASVPRLLNSHDGFHRKNKSWNFGVSLQIYKFRRPLDVFFYTSFLYASFLRRFFSLLVRFRL